MPEITKDMPADFLASFRPVDFTEIAGWRYDDHATAMACFRVTARKLIEGAYRQGRYGPNAADLVQLARKSIEITPGSAGSWAPVREFFERNFVPFRHEAADPGAANQHVVPNSQFGLVTGYYEPEVNASLVATTRFGHPLYARPPELIDVNDANRPAGWDASVRYARQSGSELEPFFDRAEIENGALAGRELEIAWLEDPVDAFFIHIQGSARLRFPDGSVRRLSFAAGNGHPYTSIGAILVREGAFPADRVTMDSIRHWLGEDSGRAAELMRANRSFIFFRLREDLDPDHGPLGAASVPLTAGRSLAVDDTLYTYGMPVWISTRRPLAHEIAPFRRLLIAQDTGSAIRGPARGDIFIGSGDEAGMIAGAIRHECEFIVFFPATSIRRLAQ